MPYTVLSLIFVCAHGLAGLGTPRPSMQSQLGSHSEDSGAEISRKTDLLRGWVLVLWIGFCADRLLSRSLTITNPGPPGSFSDGSFSLA